MSAIPKDAADIPTSFPHPTGAATVINFNCVVPPFFTTTPNPTAPAPTSPASTSASDCYYSDPSSPSSSSAAASSSASDSRLESRDFSLEQHQAEYRAHAYLANESIVKTKLAADKFLQNLFKTQTEQDKDILRAASVASRARLQNPFAYNNSRSSGSSSGSSGSSSGYSGYSSGSSGSSGSSHPRSSSGSSTSSSNPSAPTTPTTPAPCSPAAKPNHIETAAVPASEATSDLAIWPFENLAISPPAPLSPADIDEPLTEADFTDCIKLEDAISYATRDSARAPAVPSDSPTWQPVHVTTSAAAPATNPTDAAPEVLTKIGPAPTATAAATEAQSNPTTPESPSNSPSPKAPSDSAICRFGNLAISPPQPACLNVATWPFSHSTTSAYNTSWPLGP